MHMLARSNFVAELFIVVAFRPRLVEPLVPATWATLTGSGTSKPALMQTSARPRLGRRCSGVRRGKAKQIAEPTCYNI